MDALTQTILGLALGVLGAVLASALMDRHHRRQFNKQAGERAEKRQAEESAALQAIRGLISPPLAMRWDMAAARMEFEGYTDLEIANELGPRPAD